VREAQVLEQGDERGWWRGWTWGWGASTWFTTENACPRRTTSTWPARRPVPPARWAAGSSMPSTSPPARCLRLEFEPQSRLLGPALSLGMQGLADRMVDDFVREADKGGA
jgi:hypothetical protein